MKLRAWIGWILCLCTGVIHAQTPSTAPTNPARTRVVILGDSITAGYGLDPNEAYPHLLQQKIDAAQLPFEVINAGLSGDTTSGGLRRIDWVLKQPVGVLVIALGGNDGLRGIATSTTFSNLVSIAERARVKHPNVKVVMVGMQMPPNMGQDYTEAFRALFPAAAAKASATLIPFLLEGVGGKPELNQADQIHPTAAGQERIAQTVWEGLKPILNPSPGGPGSRPWP